ncbi:Lsr2 family protein [Streptomyces sp900105245]|uniref:Lsr2 family protein n=1 Tax=Streptomyces sp. 900105245 TaxID=3154379 RepID=A0ABV1UL69_9ACTN
MVQRTVTVFTDDLTGSGGDDIASHSFSLDGVSYEIDLGPDSHQQLLDALAPFIRAARKTGGSRRNGNSKRLSSGPDPVRVREWAADQGIDMSARGRVPRHVLERYEAAHL